MERDSWDELFDELYLELYASRLSKRDPGPEALGAAELARVPEGGDILDAPCGFGRHSARLRRNFVQSRANACSLFLFTANQAPLASPNEFE